MHHSRSAVILQHSTPWNSAARRSCHAVITLVARHKKVPVRLLTHKSRGCLAAARARQIAMYLSHVVFGLSLAEIGEAFGRDRTTVSYACALIEDMRDSRDFDEELCALELALEQGSEAHAA